MILSPNHSIQRTGASRSARAVLVAQWRLAPAADAGRWTRAGAFNESGNIGDNMKLTKSTVQRVSE